VAIELETKVSKINKVLTSFSKTEILMTLKANAKAIKNKKYFKNLIKFFLGMDILSFSIKNLSNIT
jgi:flagellar biosynthesis regulator FlbT